MKIEEIPAWVPDPVRRAAAAFGAGHPLIEKLLATSEMEAVWAYFEAHPVEPDFKERFARGTGLLVPDLHGLDLHWQNTPKGSQALAFLFYAVMVAINNTRYIVYSKVIDKEISKLKDTILHVEALRNFAPDPTPLSASVDRAITDVVAHCKSKIDLLDYRNKPLVLRRKGDNDVTRACIRSIGTATYALYKECSYGQLATMANVMFRSEKIVTDANVEKWCTDQPLPLMKKD